MAEKLSHVIRRIGENVGTLLDVKIAFTSATGRLPLTLTAIRDVLAELDARKHNAGTATKSGRAFIAKQASSENSQDPKSDRKRGDPKRHVKSNTFNRNGRRNTRSAATVAGSMLIDRLPN
eukprot:5528939-Pleurochrysis_carterae.AAC.2